MAYKQKSSPFNHVNSWEEEDVKRGRKLEKEGKKGHAEALFDDAHDSNRWRGGKDGSEPLHMSRELSEGGDIIDETAQRSGSFMSKHTQSGLNYGSPLHAEKTKADIKRDKQDERAADKLTNQEKRATNQTNRQSNRAKSKAKRQKDRATAKQTFKGEAAAAKTASDATNTANKLERIEKRQGRKDYRQAKSDIKTVERQEWSDATNQDSDSGLSSYKVKGKVKLDRKAIKKQASEEATKKAAKRAKK